MDIVVSAKTDAELCSFLEAWDPILRPYHLILILLNAGGSGDEVEFPHSQGLSYELYTPHEIATAVNKDLVSALCSSPHACKSFGFLVSRKQFVFTMDADCRPARDPRTGEPIDPADRHLKNLKQPSTPLFFNTLYDPYRDGADFVRGYPFSLREGVASAVSHGLWLNVPDLDAPTRIVKPRAANTTYVDAIITLPRGCLFPMSSINVSFDRKRIGAAMFLGLEALSGSDRYESFNDIWAGLCSKAICDYLGYGVKTGLPYVWRNSTTDENPFKSFQLEPQSLQWLDYLLPFFQTLQFPETLVSAEDCYLEIAKQLKGGRLNSVDPVFQLIGVSMEVWIESWKSMAV